MTAHSNACDDAVDASGAEVAEVHLGARGNGRLPPRGAAGWSDEGGDVVQAGVEDFAQSPALGGDPGAGFGQLFLEAAPSCWRISELSGARTGLSM